MEKDIKEMRDKLDELYDIVSYELIEIGVRAEEFENRLKTVEQRIEELEEVNRALQRMNETVLTVMDRRLSELEVKKMTEISWENITIEELCALGKDYDVVVDGDAKVVRLELKSGGQSC